MFRFHFYHIIVMVNRGYVMCKLHKIFFLGSLCSKLINISPNLVWCVHVNQSYFIF
uniref:Uncharacterized protein n=1 Tax=Helianthus annuus TaxID=4232 RepID=A0A251SNW6_HELAN